MANNSYQDIEIIVDGITYECTLWGSLPDSITRIVMLNVATYTVFAEILIDHDNEHIHINVVDGEPLTPNYHEFYNSPLQLVRWVAAVSC